MGKAQIARTPAAQADLNQAWDRLLSKYVLDESTPREWNDIREEATRARITVHMGTSLAYVEKDSELDSALRNLRDVLSSGENAYWTKTTTMRLCRTWAALPPHCRRLGLPILWMFTWARD